MDATLIGSLAAAAGVVITAFLGWLGQRGAKRQTAERNEARNTAAEARNLAERSDALMENYRVDLDRCRAESARKDIAIEQLHARIRKLEGE